MFVRCRSFSSFCLPLLTRVLASLSRGRPGIFSSLYYVLVLLALNCAISFLLFLCFIGRFLCSPVVVFCVSFCLPSLSRVLAFPFRDRLAIVLRSVVFSLCWVVLFAVIGFVYLPPWVVFVLFWSVRFESKPSGFLVLFWSVRFESKPSGSLVLFWSVRFESKPSGFSFYSLLSVRFESKPSGFGP